jgi:hypothetical protein
LPTVAERRPQMPNVIADITMSLEPPPLDERRDPVALRRL